MVVVEVDGVGRIENRCVAERPWRSRYAASLAARPGPPRRTRRRPPRWCPTSTSTGPRRRARPTCRTGSRAGATRSRPAGSVANTALVSTGRVIVSPGHRPTPRRRAARPSRSRCRRTAATARRSSSASNWAARKRIFDASCIDCLRMYRKSWASSGFRTTTASAPSSPFLVPPNESDVRPVRDLRERHARAPPPRSTAAPRRRAAPGRARAPDRRAPASPPTVYSVPSSVHCEIDTARGCTACSSPIRAIRLSTASGVSLPSTPGDGQQLDARRSPRARRTRRRSGARSRRRSRPRTAGTPRAARPRSRRCR